jgi:putative ABC transport system ATP-binding protein
MRDLIIELSGITKTYRLGRARVAVLDRVDLEIARGDFVSLMGPSGSGKTTLLNLIAGLDEPDVGTVKVDGRRLEVLSDQERCDLRLQTIGFVFQTINLLPALTIERNVAWPLEFCGHSRAESHHRAAEALRSVGIETRLDRRPGELAGGEQQRVAVARAIATRPAILLADEPTGNLDSRTGQTILDLLRRLNHRAGVTVVLVTHSVFVASHGDRTLDLRDGRVVGDVRTPAPAAQLRGVVRARG